MSENGDEKPALKVSIHALLRGLVKHKASDLHLRAGRPPLYRINGNLIPAKLPALAVDDVKQLAYSTMNSKQIRGFEEQFQIDFGYVMPELARFRANVFMQKGTVAMVVRMVPLSVPVLETLGLPQVVGELALKPRGLLLVTGSTGSGKSTTMAAMVEHINRHQRSHIITIEDPIEYLYEDKTSTVSQRELGIDAPTMASALKAALRQDPDVIMVGEMRDYETMHTAISAAETGHLVISTLHTNTAAQSIDRILDSFPAQSKNQIRMQMSASLVGIVNQRLVNSADGKGRVVAVEVLTKSPTVEKLILENKISELEAVMEASNVYYKMQSMNQALERLVRSRVVTLEEALRHSDRREDLQLKLSGMVSGSHGGVDAAALMSQGTNEAGVPGLAQSVADADGGNEFSLESESSGLSMEKDQTKRVRRPQPGKKVA